MQTNTMPNPPRNIESELAALRLRHTRHQRLIDYQERRKIIARERHRDGWHRRKHAPNTLI